MTVAAEARKQVQAGRASESQRPRRSTAERTTLVAILLILGALVGILAWYALQPGEDVAFEVQVEPAQQRNGRFYVPLQVRNIGKATAEDVIVRAEIRRDGATIEEAELTFRFVAGGEAAEGVAVFAENPAQGELDVGVASYLKP